MDERSACYLAWDLLTEHVGHGHGWSVKLDKAKSRLGCCSFSTKTISLSSEYVALNDEAEVRDTILHEIAHVLAGASHGHDVFWKAHCHKIGANPERCARASKIVQPPARYSAPCPNCGTLIQRHRIRSGETIKIACGECCRTYNCGKYSSKYEVVFTAPGKPRNLIG